MLILQGILRGSARIKTERGESLRLTIEHETPRDSGDPDLDLVQLYAPSDVEPPKTGSPVAVQVRAYIPKAGRSVGYSFVALE